MCKTKGHCMFNGEKNYPSYYLNQKCAQAECVTAEEEHKPTTKELWFSVR